MGLMYFFFLLRMNFNKKKKYIPSYSLRKTVVPNGMIILLEQKKRGLATRFGPVPLTTLTYLLFKRIRCGGH